MIYDLWFNIYFQESHNLIRQVIQTNYLTDLLKQAEHKSKPTDGRETYVKCSPTKMYALAGDGLINLAENCVTFRLVHLWNVHSKIFPMFNYAPWHVVGVGNSGSTTIGWWWGNVWETCIIGQVIWRHDWPLLVWCAMFCSKTFGSLPFRFCWAVHDCTLGATVQYPEGFSDEEATALLPLCLSWHNRQQLHSLANQFSK